jgi:hypothetical protein
MGAVSVARVNGGWRFGPRLFHRPGRRTSRYLRRSDAPPSIGIVLDTSVGMADKMERVDLAVEEFFKTPARGDEVFLTGFSGRTQLLTPFTHAPEDIQKGFASASETDIPDLQHWNVW